MYACNLPVRNTSLSPLKWQCTLHLLDSLLLTSMCACTPVTPTIIRARLTGNAFSFEEMTGEGGELKSSEFYSAVGDHILGTPTNF